MLTNSMYRDNICRLVEWMNEPTNRMWQGHDAWPAHLLIRCVGDQLSVPEFHDLLIRAVKEGVIGIDHCWMEGAYRSRSWLEYYLTGANCK